MSYEPGRLLNALVRDVEGEVSAVVYLSLIVPGDNGSRQNYCWRYAPPSNAVVTGHVTPGEYVKPPKPKQLSWQKDGAQKT
jgi:hypothetical protein